MTTTSQFKDLNEFLAKHSAKNDQKVGDSVSFTHTRIPNKDLNIYGGSFVIPQNELPLFYNLYYESIFVKKRKEYLTEKQLETGGQMAVDFDFRYNPDIIERQHNPEHISDMVCEYSEILKECYLVKPDEPFDIFIFEKPNVNRSDNTVTKDGIHMIIGMQIDHTMQMIIREKMITQLASIWELPLINSWESVLDEGISKGKTNWQLFGSRKPGYEAYELTRHFIMTIDPSDGQYKMDEEEVRKFDLKNNFEKLSIQYNNAPKFEINPKIINEYNKNVENKSHKIKKASSKIKMNLISDNDDEEDENDEYISINNINNKETLDKAVNLMLSHLKSNEYEISETHYFTQILPAKYYESGSHLLNRQVAFALKHTDERLFLSWVQLRSKASDFDYNCIPELHSLWKKFHKSNQDGFKVTRKSIMYWVRKENFEEYEKIKQQTIDYFLDKYFETGTEYDAAMVLKQMYKDKFVCVSYDKKGIWFQFRNHRWISDKGLSLRSKISEELYILLQSKMEQNTKELYEYQDDDDRKSFLQKKLKVIGELSIKLKRTNDKNNIMREAAEIFYDGEFIRSMDTNKYLMCFNNGVVDFINKNFREGYPEDYISKTTKINYTPFDENNVDMVRISDEINGFMTKLFPIQDLNKYMWDHFASCLIGANKNQTFNVYHGSGSNGKSIIADLMSVTLGEYKGTVPITLVTDVRGKIGGTSDEVLKLKGVRYAVMQEPTKGVKLNEGIMKELTGGDPIQARGLYSESEIFEPQFNLVVCTNNLFDVESNDDGTWRRIRKCDFISKFIDEGETYQHKTQYVYLKDKNLKDKLPSFAPIFASMLIKIAFKTEGIVEDCQTVINASNKYRMGQDHISAFINEMTIKVNDQSMFINKTGLNYAFKKWFEETQGSRKPPKAEELHECMREKYGPNGAKGWPGVKFYEPNEDADIISEL